MLIGLPSRQTSDDVVDGGDDDDDDDDDGGENHQPRQLKTKTQLTYHLQDQLRPLDTPRCCRHLYYDRRKCNPQT